MSSVAHVRGSHKLISVKTAVKTSVNNIGAAFNLGFTSSAVINTRHRRLISRRLVKNVDVPSYDRVRMHSARYAQSDRELNTLIGLCGARLIVHI